MGGVEGHALALDHGLVGLDAGTLDADVEVDVLHLDAQHHRPLGADDGERRIRAPAAVLGQVDVVVDDARRRHLVERLVPPRRVLGAAHGRRVDDDAVAVEADRHLHAEPDLRRQLAEVLTAAELPAADVEGELMVVGDVVGAVADADADHPRGRAITFGEQRPGAADVAAQQLGAAARWTEAVEEMVEQSHGPTLPHPSRTVGGPSVQTGAVSIWPLSSAVSSVRERSSSLR
jgi:hypothetical protein